MVLGNEMAAIGGYLSGSMLTQRRQKMRRTMALLACMVLGWTSVPTQRFDTSLGDAMTFTQEEVASWGPFEEVAPSRAGAFVRGFAKAVLPTVGGVGVAIGTSALIGLRFASSPSIGIGSVVAGILTGIGAGSVLQQVQHWALDQMGFREGTGPFSAAQEMADGIEHGVTEKIGGLSLALVLCLWWAVRRFAIAGFGKIASRLGVPIHASKEATQNFPSGEQAIKLNPLQWSPEHRVLGFASAAGAVAAIAVGFAIERLRGQGFADWLAHDPADALIWSVVGALVVGTVVYCYRVLSTNRATAP